MHYGFSDYRYGFEVKRMVNCAKVSDTHEARAGKMGDLIANDWFLIENPAKL